ncbi:hypothetical protein LQW54_001123 [Pestalotiopsis sp. IQ-011]
MTEVQMEGKAAPQDTEKSVYPALTSVQEPTSPAGAEEQRRTRLERYAYYAYFFANSGVGPFNYSALLFQNLMYQAGFDPDVAPLGSQPCGDHGPCHVFWAGGTKEYASVVNIGSGLTFLGQALFFVLLGATGDYGTWSPWILRTATLVYSAFQFGYLGVKTPDTWGSALALGVSWSAFPYLGVVLQVRFGLGTKTMLYASNVGCCLLAAWGAAGIWTNAVGYHNEWEFWMYACLCGAAVGVQWSYSQAFMGELTPRGHENHFFSLLGVVSKGGSWIGPIISSALIDRTQNAWVPFGFVALLTGVSTLLLVFVDEARGRADCERFLGVKAEQTA